MTRSSSTPRQEMFKSSQVNPGLGTFARNVVPHGKKMTRNALIKNDLFLGVLNMGYDESRRVELRLEFLGIGESRPLPAAAPHGGFGQCALGG
jgi:hypothetical protein